MVGKEVSNELSSSPDELLLDDEEDIFDKGLTSMNDED